MALRFERFLSVAVVASALGAFGCGGGGEVKTVIRTVAPRDTTVAVPDVRHEPLKRARRIMKRAAISVRIRRRESNEPSGEVIRQTPSAGVRVDRGSVVRITVAKPKAPTVISCGDLAQGGAGSYNVRAFDVDCGMARLVATQWEDECAQQPSGSCQVSAGFYCSFQDAGYELGYIACTSGTRRVTFETGA
jgi:hypothetical protein